MGRADEHRGPLLDLVPSDGDTGDADMKFTLG